MKIAIITETFYPSTDGIVTRLTASIRYLKQLGHEVLVIAPDLGETEYEGTPISGIPAFQFFFYKEKKFSLISRKVKTALEDFQPDLVHVVNPALLGITGIYYTKKLKFPLVASYHTHVPKYAEYYRAPFIKPILWWYFRTLHNRAEVNLCTSQTVLEELKQQQFRNVHLWIRGVDTDRFHPGNYSQEMRERLTNEKTDKKLLLFVGRLAPEKDIEKLRAVFDQSDDFCLAIVGDGPHRSVLENKFSGTDTVFTGFLHGEELAGAYASADAFVFPSTTETLGLVLLEAMASGTPVIAADSGPTREQVEHEKTGLLYNPEVENHLVTTILRIKEESFRTSLAEQAYSESQSVGWDAPSRQLLEFYEDTVSASRSSLKQV
ncbi:glycosyltransferase family 4 protein [Alkalicoccus halolimnae]|uniref:Glycosyltransferase family 1 protein n=1 Tax=Alkalicoccus halolimnae TaxID=1667239 RepID=A0A5C7EZY9_9BACI|nr:glycosyltransferase family 1 protein [Alkalicoccus halolimnae]TXF82297.1 glycosyltransferase family 1 protein [Alkalicoccus halolimnae]